MPTLYTVYEESHGGPQIGGKKKHGSNTKVTASIEEEVRKWKINLYQFDQSEENQDSSYLKIGDVIWLPLPERKVTISF